MDGHELAHLLLESIESVYIKINQIENVKGIGIDKLEE
jgi:hypothetical protein